MTSIPLETRFWQRVHKTPDCWLWIGSICTNGYGRIAIGRRYFLAHRVAWELMHGPIPDGLQVLHACDVRACVRHLFLGTQSDNLYDMHRKQRGRPRRGVQHPRARLNEAQVQEIRARYAAGGVTVERLAADYGISPNATSCLIRRKTWKHVL